MLRRMRRALSLLALVLFAGPACIVDDTIPDGLRELRPEIGTATLHREPGGAGRLDFQFRYVLAITDDTGIAEVRWRYRLVDRDDHALAEVTQRMRNAEPDKDRILVQGERTRTLPVPAGLQAGQTYVLRVAVMYPDEAAGEKTIGELLWPVTAD
jgi:hypothetical protein